MNLSHDIQPCYLTGWLLSVRHSARCPEGLLFILCLPNNPALRQGFPDDWVKGWSHRQDFSWKHADRSKVPRVYLCRTCALAMCMAMHLFVQFLCPATVPLALSYHNLPFEGWASILLLLSTHCTCYYVFWTLLSLPLTRLARKESVCLWSLCLCTQHCHCSRDKAKFCPFRHQLPSLALVPDHPPSSCHHCAGNVPCPSLYSHPSCWILSDASTLKLRTPASCGLIVLSCGCHCI